MTVAGAAEGQRSPRDQTSAAITLAHVEKRLEWPMAILALIVIPALVLETWAKTPGIREAATLVNWVVWLAFCGDFAVRCWVSPRRLHYVRRAWVDLAIIVLSPPFLAPEALQGVRGLRALRLLRLLRLLRAVAFLTIGLKFAHRALQHHQFHYVVLFATAVVGSGAIGIYVVERGANRAIGSFPDALWWAVVTATTVGYGDVSPVTPEGRLIAVVVMITGIAVVSAFTATIASYLFGRDKESEAAKLEARLESIDAKLNELLERDRDH